MKKLGIFVFLSLLSALFIVGCGSNTKADPTHPTTGPYAFINPSSPLEVSESNETYELSVQLLKDGHVHEGGEVTIQPFDIKYGKVAPNTQTTDVDGWAVFPYLPPEDLKSLAGQSTTVVAIFDDGNGSVVGQDFVINYLAPPSPSPCELNHLTEQTTPIYVDINASSEQEISVYVVNDCSNLGVEGEIVTIGILNGEYGSISPASVETDASGKAVFAYTSPANMTDLGGKSKIVNINYIKNGVTTSLPVKIIFVAP